MLVKKQIQAFDRITVQKSFLVLKANLISFFEQLFVELTSCLRTLLETANFIKQFLFKELIQTTANNCSSSLFSSTTFHCSHLSLALPLPAHGCLTVESVANCQSAANPPYSFSSPQLRWPQSKGWSSATPSATRGQWPTTKHRCHFGHLRFHPSSSFRVTYYILLSASSNF